MGCGLSLLHLQQSLALDVCGTLQSALGYEAAVHSQIVCARKSDRTASHFQMLGVSPARNAANQVRNRRTGCRLMSIVSKMGNLKERHINPLASAGVSL